MVQFASWEKKSFLECLCEYCISLLKVSLLDNANVCLFEAGLFWSDVKWAYDWTYGEDLDSKATKLAYKRLCFWVLLGPYGQTYEKPQFPESE